uniref:Gustatory receptor n=1 Tax=Strigamia maritima TaxID=126957 RepID=T1JHV2_STRMM
MAKNAEWVNNSIDDLGLGFVNRVWRVLFGFYGLQVDILDGESKSWKKIIYGVVIRVAHGVAILHFIFIFGCRFKYKENQQIHHAFGLLAISNLLLTSYFTAIVCLRREKRIIGLYSKIVRNLSSAGGLLKKFDRSTKKYFFGLIVNSVVLGIIHILAEVENGDINGIYRKIYADFGIHNYLLSKITAWYDCFVIIVFSYCFMDAMIVYFIHLCAGLAFNFVLFNRCLGAELRGMSLSPSKLNLLRHKYAFIAGLIEDIGVIFSPLILLWIFSLVTNLCYDIRVLKATMPSGTVLPIARFVFQFFRGIIFIFMIFKVASRINTQADLMKQKLSSKVMAENRDNDTSKTFYANYSLFSETINRCQVGISISGLFTLNMTSLLSIAGTVLTYTIILYQS